MTKKLLNTDITLICQLQGLILENNIDKPFENGLFTAKPEHIIKTLSDLNFLAYHGARAAESIHFSTNYVVNTNMDDLKRVHGIEDVLQISHNTHLVIEFFTMCMWLLKDCAVSQLYLFTNIPSEPRTFAQRSISLFTNAKGEFENSIFSKSELSEVSRLMLKIKPLLTKGAKATQQVLELNTYRFGDHRHIKNSKLSRVTRAWIFLVYARSTTVISLKVSFYVMSLETLFSSDNNGEISHKVSERVAIYLGGPAEQEKDTFKQVKSIYGIRSKYVHGDKGNVDISESVIADTLLRKVMRKILLGDHAKFNEENEKLTEYFNNLVFRGEVKRDV